MLYLLILAFIGTLTSQSAMDLFVTLYALTLLVQGLRKKGPAGWKLFEKMGLEYFWPVFVITIILGFLVNGHYEGPLFKRMTELLWILSFYFTVSCYRYVDLDLKKAMKFSLIVGLLVSIGSIIVSAVKGEPRVGGILNNAMTTAHSYGLVFLTLAGVFLSRWQQMWKEDRKEFYLWVFSLAVMGATLILTMTRGVWVGMFVGLVVVAAVLSLRLASVVIGLGIAIVTGMFFLWPKFHDRILLIFNYEHTYDSQRIILWKTNWMIFKDHPWLGAGYGENYTLLPKYYAMQGLPADQFVGHAHNQFLHMLAGTGIVGLLCYVFLYFFFVVKAWGVFKVAPPNSWEKAVSLGIFGSLIGFAVGGLTESNFEHAKVRMVVIFLWALIFFMKQNLGLRKS
ncbi:O-antigen ligase family protein [Bdellovibrio reynosensis]|uniref:O-antigen ligase family protein n=1 Tax=Bdellovibrio reynosensis TaxID=2835041 RepID=A0ABY4CER4_9BACT|nr:O-antigen ligase family protein [Bdellovibrio reynosensis]UOF02261.1 O-antigen ligase family protein [Bdellovibrio reynosensis]